MKILILASNPRKDLNLEREIRHLQGVIERSKNREHLEVKVGFAVQPEDLQGLLLRHEPDIVHFCGHGTGKQGLVLEDDTLIEQLVSTNALSNLFELCSGWVKCVLLNACYSEVQANAIVQHIDYAIGMNHEIADDAAIAFATGFYQALGYGQPIKQSYKFGCNAIQLQISGNSTVRSALSEEKRKLAVATTVERVVIPEYLKPVLKIKPNLATSVDKSASDGRDNLLPSTKLDLQSYIDQALAKEIAKRQYHPEFKLVDQNIRFNSHSSASKKNQTLFFRSIVATLALVLTSSLLSKLPQSERELEKPIESPLVSPKPTEMTAEELLDRGWDKYQEGYYQEAIENLTQAIQLKPDYHLAYYNRGLVYFDLKKYQTAIEDFNQAVAIDLHYAHVYYNRGLAYYKLKDYQEAIEDFTQMIEIDLNYAYVYYSRGLAYSDLKQYQKAISDYEKAAKLYQQKGNILNYQKALDRIKELQQ